MSEVMTKRGTRTTETIYRLGKKVMLVTQTSGSMELPSSRRLQLRAPVGFHVGIRMCGHPISLDLGLHAQNSDWLAFTGQVDHIRPFASEQPLTEVQTEAMK